MRISSFVSITVGYKANQPYRCSFKGLIFWLSYRFLSTEQEPRNGTELIEYKIHLTIHKKVHESMVARFIHC